ncbi:hypothetical protein NE237_002231 [Protea cynaroides]|uniref:Uncharacterized protein n=1 Tax=Protea cynaroides TaxID=273540 RepID=A0A9Q0QYU8_9MAGN|nr:hypothetical protein NE237_002231 [Protea cynaroides]
MISNKLVVIENNGYIVTREHIGGVKLTNLEIIIVDLEDNQILGLVLDMGISDGDVSGTLLRNNIDLIIPRGSIVARRSSPVDSQPLLQPNPISAELFITVLVLLQGRPLPMDSRYHLRSWFHLMPAWPPSIKKERKKNEMQSKLGRWCRRRWKITDLKPLSDVDVLKY